MIWFRVFSDSSNNDQEDTSENKTLVAKEHFVFTDTEGQLYHFSVEGNSIRDGTKVPAEGSLCKFSQLLRVH
jgi:hypothetical protein